MHFEKLIKLSIYGVLRDIIYKYFLKEEL